MLCTYCSAGLDGRRSKYKTVANWVTQENETLGHQYLCRLGEKKHLKDEAGFKDAIKKVGKTGRFCKEMQKLNRETNGPKYRSKTNREKKKKH